MQQDTNNPIDNQTISKPWFGQKRNGMGYGPMSWQGWIITALMAIGILYYSLQVRGYVNAEEWIKGFGIPVGMMLVVYCVIGYYKGEIYIARKNAQGYDDSDM